jgi:outer membrane protein assembly factor BamD (BamD/ComL family)
VSARPRPEAKSGLTTTAELEEVNRLFVEAKRARREHRDADALNLLQQLLTKHSGSVLVHEATVERFRALARLGRTEEARRHAQAYLARYPSGFAADEARTLAGAGP